MKTQNTPENKAKFFALHLYVPCHVEPVFGQHVQVLYGIDLDNADESDYLQLRPLSSATHEQILQVCKIHYPTPFSSGNNLKWEVIDKEGYKSVESKFNDYSFSVDMVDGSIDVYHDLEPMPVPGGITYDYWRSEGILVGYLDLTSEDIIKFGWARLDGKG